MECGYRFTIKEFSKTPGTLFVKFAQRDGDPAEGLCQSMQHVRVDGKDAHGGRSDHIRYTEEMRQFVLEKLKAGCQVKVVLEGVCKQIWACINVHCCAAVLCAERTDCSFTCMPVPTIRLCVW